MISLCNRDLVEKAVSRIFRRLGGSLARKPGWYILGTILVAAALSSGIYYLDYVDDPEYLFAPINSRSQREKLIIEELFPTNTSANFEVGRATSARGFARIIAEAKGDTILTQEIWKDLIQLDFIIRRMTISHGGELVDYEKACARDGRRCFGNSFLEKLDEIMGDVEVGRRKLKYPLEVIGNRYYPTGILFGGCHLDSNSTSIETAKAVSLYYYLDTSTLQGRERAHQWEHAFLQLMSQIQMPSVHTYHFASISLAAELERNTISVSPMITITVVLMLVFTMVSCSVGDSWVEAKPWVGFLSCVTVLFSVASATGVLAFCGVPFIGINLAAPFLMLGIGLDDTFVMLSSWRHTDSKKSVEERMSETFGEAGVSITITSLTNLISFGIGALSPFPSVQIFCEYTAACSLLTYVFQILFLGSCLAITGHLEAYQLHGLLCYQIKLEEKEEESGCASSNPECEKQRKSFFRDVLAKFLSKSTVKCMAILVFVCYISGAVLGCLQLREGLDRARLTLDISYARKFFLADDKYFKIFPYRIQIVFNRPLNYTKNEVGGLLRILSEFESSPYVKNRVLTECWFREARNSSLIRQSFKGFAKRIKIKNMTDYLSAPGISNFRRDIRWFNKKTIASSRCVIQAHDVRSSNDEKAMMVDLRAIADRHPQFNMTVFNPMFLFFDQFLLVRETTIKSISIATLVMVVVALVFIPSTWAVVWVAFSIVSIEVGVIGYMTLWGVNLDSISMINLIMCIGFSVDYSAHVAYSFLSGKTETANGRMAEALGALGLPIVQGAISTILGIIILAFTPSYIFMTFFKTVFLVIAFGAVHGLVFLPVFLSLTFKK